MWNPFKKVPKIEQEIALKNEVGNIEFYTLPVVRDFAADHDRSRAFRLDGSNQVFDNTTGRYVQICSVFSTNPIPIYGALRNKVTKDSLDKISEEGTDDAIAFVHEQKDKRRRTMFIGWALIIVTLMMVILIAVGLFQKGSIQWPF